MRYILRHKVKLGLVNGEELDTGNQILAAFVTPKISNNSQPAPADYEQQRAMYKAIKYLRGANSECSVELGDYIALEDAWYEHLMYQMKHWPWGINDPAIFDMIQDFEKAPDVAPLQLVKQTMHQHFDGVSLVPVSSEDS